MRVEALTPDERPYHRPLLLLGDEQWDMVERYLGRGEMFALRERGETVAIAVVTDEGGGVYEVKNLAVSPERQRHGHGRALLAFLAGWYGGRGSTLRVGTGDAPGTLAFYRRCGFERSHVVRNFFTDYYDHPIIEEGRRLRDMVYLRKTLTPRAAEGLWAILPYEGRFLRAMARVFHEAVHVLASATWWARALWIASSSRRRHRGAASARHSARLWSLGPKATSASAPHSPRGPFSSAAATASSGKSTPSAPASPSPPSGCA